MRVAFNPTQPLSLVFGGFEMQAITARTALQKYTSVDAIDLSWWDRDAKFDGVHLFGTVSPSVARAAKARGVFVIMTLLVNYYPGVAGIAHGFASRLLGMGAMLRKVAPYVDGVVVVNRMQQRSVVKCLGFPASKVVVIPNAIGDEFVGPADVPLGERPFDVICCGTVCRRKNQVALMRACCAVKAKLLLIGGVARGDDDYARAFHGELERSPSVEWVGEVDPRRRPIRDFYSRARSFALVSEREEQPISALEAKACGLNLLLSDRPFARDPLFSGALLVEPSREKLLATQVKRLIQMPAARVEAGWREQVSERSIAIAHQQMYEKSRR